MSSKIKILPEEIVNQIAAGEVVESPASVVKELVENALDAGATKIEVQIFGGGLQKIVVSDDGMGMNLEDMLCSLQRHATSKISAFADLMHLKTMGFRGEALASIAAVSQLTMESASQDLDAHIIHVEGGKEVRYHASSRTKGTTIQVESLFFNVPARKRFQKSVKAMVAEIHRVMTKVALAYPSIGFSFSSSTTKMIQVESCQLGFKEALEKRIEELFGTSLFSKRIPIFLEDCPLQLQGFLSPPFAAKHSRSSQYLFINNRPVFSPLIDRAIREGYGTRLSEGFHPLFVLHLNLPYEMVDVNVHPQKREVRLRDELFLKGKLASMISSSLNCSSFTLQEEPQVSIDAEKCYSSALPSVFQEEKPSFVHQNRFSLEQEKKICFHGIKMIGSFYLVEMAFSNQLMFIDLAGAYGRLLFDLFFRGLEKDKTMERQGLLSPVIIELSREEIIEIEGKQELFCRLGWEFRILGPQTLAIDAFPSYVEEKEISLLFSLIREEVVSLGESSAGKNNFLKKIAEKLSSFARGRKKQYSLAEADLLIEKLWACKDPKTDPLGRSIILHFTSSHIQDLFLGGEKK